MNYEFKGSSHDYCIEDDTITISKKNAIVYTGNISDIVLLNFMEKNIFGMGQFVLSLPNRTKPLADSFRKKDRSKFIELFQILEDKTKFLDLGYAVALRYAKPEIWKERDLKRNASIEKLNVKKELLQQKLQKKSLKPIKETKCVCSQCNTVWFYGNDKLKNASNTLIALGSHLQGKSLTGTYHEELVKDNSKCPKCGSRAINKTVVKHTVNENGDYAAE